MTKGMPNDALIATSMAIDGEGSRLAASGIRILHKGTSPIAPIILAHILALIIALLLASLKVAPQLPVLAFLALLLRAWIGFSAQKTRVSAKQIGLREIGFGAITVFIIPIGYRLGW